MGMTLTVTFASGPPHWAEVAMFLAERGYPVQMRMIDGQLAFPDEVPAEPWQELRVATPARDTITLRRTGTGIDLVVWGNAGAEMRQGWHALAWALATVGGGQIDGAGELDLPMPLRG